MLYFQISDKTYKLNCIYNPPQSKQFLCQLAADVINEFAPNKFRRRPFFVFSSHSRCLMAVMWLINSTFG